MSSQKVEQTREEKLAEIKECVLLKLLLFYGFKVLKRTQRDPYSAPEMKEENTNSVIKVIENIQHILRKFQDKSSTQLDLFIDDIVFEFHENTTKQDEGELIHPDLSLFYAMESEELIVEIAYWKSESRIVKSYAELIRFTDAGLSLLSRFL